MISSSPAEKDDCNEVLNRLDSSVKDLILKIERESQRCEALEQSLTEHSKDIREEVEKRIA